MAHVIYAIIDPRDSRPFYIGRASNFPRRKRQHIDYGHGLSGLHIQKIKQRGLTPLFAILEHCKTEAQAIRAETFWIEICKARGVPIHNKENTAIKGPSMAGTPWTAIEDERLKELILSKASLSEMASIFQRTHSAISSRIRYLKESNA